MTTKITEADEKLLDRLYPQYYAVAAAVLSCESGTAEKLKAESLRDAMGEVILVLDPDQTYQTCGVLD